MVKEFEGNFECLGENTEKYITFSAPIKKKIENKNIEITYKKKFIDSYRFMSMPRKALLGRHFTYRKDFIIINVLIVNLVLIILKLKMKS